MEDKIRVSVAMATYNGEKYIKEQLDSILMNLSNNDEIIISDDGSTDTTINIIKSYKDERIKILEGPKKGVKKNFENAIKNTSGAYIFLADQDDIWEKNKVETILDEFYKNTDITLIVHDAKVFNSKDNKIIYESFFKYRKSKKGIVKNWLKNSYIGCCMAFKRDLKKVILPIPNNIEMHDQWIGIINEIDGGKTKFLSQNLLMYRRHSKNVSDMKCHPIRIMLKNRLNLIKELIKSRR